MQIVKVFDHILPFCRFCPRISNPFLLLHRSYAFFEFFCIRSFKLFIGKVQPKAIQIETDKVSEKYICYIPRKFCESSKHVNGIL